MPGLDIQPLGCSDLPEVAVFLRRWHDANGETPANGAVRRESSSIEGCLKWLLVSNPVQSNVPSHGFGARDGAGVVKGLCLNFPGAFLAGDRRLLGLCSGSFFVEPEVRTAGYFLFKRYLSTPDYAFFFATTCNSNSGVLWERLGGTVGPDSQTEYILPLRYEVMLDAFLEKKKWGRMGNSLARILGRCASGFRKIVQTSGHLSVESCRDWDKLAALSERYRNQNWITSDRSAEFLKWRYGAGSPNESADVCLFRDSSGNEGWFATGKRRFGRNGPIDATILLDAVWPPSSMSFRLILPALYRRIAGNSDALYLPPRLGVEYGASSRWIIQRSNRFENDPC
jgi:hypothetical protein